MILQNLIKSKQAVKFVIFFQERSGSTYLTDLLNQHPGIFCGKEVFHLDWQNKTATNLPDRRIFTKEESLLKLSELYSKKKQAAGFKYKYPTQFKNYAEIWEKLIEDQEQVRLIFLYRINRLKAAVSKQNHAKLIAQTKESNLKTEDKLELGKLDLDIPQAIKYMKWREFLDAKFLKQTAGFKHRHIISYEKLKENQDLELNKLFSFLGVKEKKSISSSFKKVTSDNLAHAISNYKELEQRLICSPLEKYLY